MNSIYRQLKVQIAPEQYYSGNGILSGMLKIIKIYTIRVLQQVTSDDEDGEEQSKYDVFSAFVYVPENGGEDGWRDLQQQASIEVLSKTYSKLPEVGWN